MNGYLRDTIEHLENIHQTRIFMQGCIDDATLTGTLSAEERATYEALRASNFQPALHEMKLAAVDVVWA
jgi:hypothetical protein